MSINRHGLGTRVAAPAEVSRMGSVKARMMHAKARRRISRIANGGRGSGTGSAAAPPGGGGLGKLDFAVPGN